MGSIRTAIELQDNFTGVLYQVINSVNLGLSAMEDLHQTMNNPVDTASFDAAREAANQATIAVQQMGAAMQGIETPASETPTTPVQWQPDALEVFKTTGTERFQQEVQSANNMLNTLNRTQSRIAAQATQTDLFPDNAVADMNNMQNRLEGIQQRIQTIENNPLNMGSDTANAELEQLRAQLDQAVQEQEALNRAVENMDVEAANQAYLRLSQTVSNTERYIRDNVDEQGRFNREIEEGTNEANSLMQTIKGTVAAYATIQALSAALNLSDQLTSTTARMNLMNDGLQTTQDLQNMIFLSAERARGSYQATADAVSKLGLMAGDAFGSSQEIIAFMEQVNKQFTIAGTEAAGIDAAMLQLTQAMGSGVLRGEEYNSILEQAPNIIQAIADYMEVPKGQLKDMAAEGQITADIVKAAMFAAADDTNAKFEQMPKTFSQIWTSFQNTALMAFQPVLQRMNEIANSEAFQTFVDNAVEGLSVVAGVALEIFDFMIRIGDVISDNWSQISPIIYGAAGALAVYYGWLLVVKTAEAISKGVKIALTIAEYAHAAAMGVEVSATAAATAAQYGLNTAMYACPIVWIIALIVALIAAIILLWNNCEGFRNFMVDMYADQTKALAKFYNDVVVPVGNGIITAQTAVAGAIRDGCIAITNFIADMVISAIKNISWLVDVMRGMIDMYNSIAGVFGGTQINADILLTEQGIDAVRKETISNIESVLNSLPFSPLRELNLDKVNALVDNIADGVRNFTISDFVNSLLSDLFAGDIPNADDYANLGNYGSGLDLNGIGNGVDDIAGNTGAIADSMDITEEDLKYLRDIAEQEAINRFTTAEITIEQTNNNNISSSMDLDGVVSGLTDAVNEAVDIIAEGVHE